MGGLAGFAAEIRDVAGRAQAGLARDAVNLGARAYLAVLKGNTPVRSGRLRDSELVWSVSGGGESATAVVGSDLIYARFRNDGGTIRVKNARVLTDGVSFFGKSVTQAGSHYKERSEGPGHAVVAAACREAADRIFTL